MHERWYILIDSDTRFMWNCKKKKISGSVKISRCCCHFLHFMLDLYFVESESRRQQLIFVFVRKFSIKSPFCHLVHISHSLSALCSFGRELCWKCYIVIAVSLSFWQHTKLFWRPPNILPGHPLIQNQQPTCLTFLNVSTAVVKAWYLIQLCTGPHTVWEHTSS